MVTARSRWINREESAAGSIGRRLIALAIGIPDSVGRQEGSLSALPPRAWRAAFRARSI